MSFYDAIRCQQKVGGKKTRPAAQIPEEKKVKIYSLLGEGVMQKDIAVLVGVSTSIVSRLARGVSG